VYLLSVSRLAVPECLVFVDRASFSFCMFPLNCMKQNCLWQHSLSRLTLFGRSPDSTCAQLPTHSFHNGHVCPDSPPTGNPYTTNDSWASSLLKLNFNFLGEYILDEPPARSYRQIGPFSGGTAVPDTFYPRLRGRTCDDSYRIVSSFITYPDDSMWVERISEQSLRLLNNASLEFSEGEAGQRRRQLQCLRSGPCRRG
jgi:hypothetical protein